MASYTLFIRRLSFELNFQVGWIPFLLGIRPITPIQGLTPVLHRTLKVKVVLSLGSRFCRHHHLMRLVAHIPSIMPLTTPHPPPLLPRLLGAFWIRLWCKSSLGMLLFLFHHHPVNLPCKSVYHLSTRHSTTISATSTTAASATSASESRKHQDYHTHLSRRIRHLSPR